MANQAVSPVAVWSAWTGAAEEHFTSSYIITAGDKSARVVGAVPGDARMVSPLMAFMPATAKVLVQNLISKFEETARLDKLDAVKEMNPNSARNSSILEDWWSMAKKLAQLDLTTVEGFLH